ncbi:MAG TPA: gamma-glutamylcyclotransferase family protein [Vicinamibacterales bacterium]|nr:gamma-glutamylcyclotransferase family protein [Vicinamibacterales bacterium]
MISSRFPQRDSLLFVYGTLRPFVDIPMARWLHRVARHVGTARTCGRLYDLGRYPGLCLGLRRGEWVVGDLYCVRRSAIYRVLDRYEAGDTPGRPRFTRQRCTVWLAARRRRSAWVYVYRRRVAQRSRIAHGDYQRHAGRC